MNFTFVASLPASVVVERDGQYLEVTLDNVAAYARLTPIERGVWSARWAAVAYPWLIRRTGEVLTLSRHPALVLAGISLEAIGRAGLREAAEAGIPEAGELHEEEEQALPVLVAALGVRCNLDANVLVELEHLRGAQAREIGARGQLFTTQAAAREFSVKGNWRALQRRFNIQVLRAGATYQRWFKEAQRMGLRVKDALVLAGSKAYNLPLVTADAQLQAVARRLGVVVRFFRPYTPRPGAPRRRPVRPRVPRFRIPRVRVR